MRVVPVEVREDNLMYIVCAKIHAVLVDPIDPASIKRELEQEGVPPESVKLSLTTHHHLDHSIGNPRLKGMFPEIEVISGSHRSHCDRVCGDGEVMAVDSLRIRCVSTPCHTQDSMCYAVADVETGEAAIFTGDTLFYLGCGRFFEGSAREMLASLLKIRELGDSALVYYGHDYRTQNMNFRALVLGSNDDLDVGEGRFLTLGEEKKYNLFLNLSLLSGRAARSGGSHLEEFRNCKDDEERLGLLRRLKDSVG